MCSAEILDRSYCTEVCRVEATTATTDCAARTSAGGNQLVISGWRGIGGEETERDRDKRERKEAIAVTCCSVIFYFTFFSGGGEKKRKEEGALAERRKTPAHKVLRFRAHSIYLA